MRTIILTITIICLSSILFAENSTKDNEKAYTSVGEIPKNKYYITDYMPAEYKICYGNWKAVRTSGGFDGSGFALDFDHLVLKPNGIFGILQNDSLIAYGKMALEKKGERLNCRFIFDVKAKIELANDYEKFFQLTHPDTLVLVAPCCDRYNIKLAREK
jgi:hypothetical protein